MDSWSPHIEVMVEMHYSMNSVLQVKVAWFYYPEHLLTCHYFLGKSYFATDRDDEIEAFKHLRQVETNTKNVTTTTVGTRVKGQGKSSSRVVKDSERSKPQKDVGDQYIDWRWAYIFNDCPDSDPGILHALKKKCGGQVVHSMAVQEHGTYKYAKIIRRLSVFVYPIIKSINFWMAVPRSDVHNYYLFCKNIIHERKEVCEACDTRQQHGDEYLLNDIERTLDNSVCCMNHPMPRVSLTKHRTREWDRRLLHRCFFSSCQPLNVETRFSDCFILRPFQVTVTNAGNILFSSNLLHQKAVVQMGP